MMAPAVSEGTAPATSRRRLVHAAMVAWALLLRWLSAPQAAALAVAALIFNTAILPRLNLDLSKRSASGERAVAWRGIRLYPFTVLVLIALFPHQLYAVAAGWAVLALGDPAAAWWGEAHPGAQRWPGSSKTLGGSLCYGLAGAAGALGFLAYLQAPAAPWEMVTVAVLAAAAAAGVEALPLGLDDNFLPPLVAAGIVALALAHPAAPRPPAHLIEGFAVCGALAVAAYGLRLVTLGAAVSGWALAVAIYGGLGRGGFACLLAFFVLGAGATKLGYERKRRRGAAEARGGQRDATQVLANGLAPAAAAALGWLVGAPGPAALAAVAALATATSDTLASEIGQAWGREPVLIFGGQRVAVGSDGGISAVGTAAGAAGAALLGICAAAVGLVPWPTAAWLAGLGFAGNLWDSVLGAVWERRGELSNDEVNFLATLAAALAAVLLGRL